MAFDSLESGKLDYELVGEIARIRFASPKTLNACGLDVAEDLLRAFERAFDEARCVILTGSGRAFCSGADLSSNINPNIAGMKPDSGRSLATHYNEAIRAMREAPIPIVTAVNGVAAGVGCSFALMGDIILTAESAYFLQAFRRIGLVPDGGSTWLLPRLVGRARALEMMLLGEKISAETALDWGLVNRVVADDQLEAEAMVFAEKLVNGPPVALSLMRKLVNDGEALSFDEALQAERKAQRIAGRTEDAREGVKAFLEKRAARFTGR